MDLEILDARLPPLRRSFLYCVVWCMCCGNFLKRETGGCFFGGVERVGSARVCDCYTRIHPRMGGVAARVLVPGFDFREVEQHE